MDWTEKIEQKKKIRKMAYRMLWADVRDLVMSWKVLFVITTYFGFFLLAYLEEAETYNAAAMCYFVMWVFSAIGALSETSFNYLPLSSKDIVYYLKCRTNHLAAWLVLISGITGIALDAAGAEVFWERGLIILLFLLIILEWYFGMMLYSYSKPEQVRFYDAEMPKSRMVWVIIYNFYSVILLFASMIVGMFMKYNEHAKTKVLVVLCAYLVMYIFRAEAVRWVEFKEYNKTPRRSLYAQQGSTDLKDMMNQQ